MAKNITAEELRTRLRYDPDTGDFTWLKHGWSTRIGTIAGYPNDRGYRNICLDGKFYRAHRLAWLYMTGEWPEQEIDHINCAKSDNRWHNLRDIGRTMNAQNERFARSNSTHGFLGAVYRGGKNGHWKANIAVDGVKRAWGRFPTAEAANAAYIEEKRRVHPGCTI